MSIAKLKKMNWLKRLEYADKNKLTQDECNWLYDRAADWPTCACGVACKSLPRNLGGAPMDFYLRQWGHRFFSEVRQRDYKAARKTFLKIERRSAMLLEIAHQKSPAVVKTK
jgi:hypothetical protein